MKKWKVLSKKKEFKSEDEIIEELFSLRNITNKKRDKFLNPSLKDLTAKNSGISQKELEKAIERIQKAIKNSEKIIILGDYDVDGICATAILWETIYKKHKNVLPYIPDRFTEGYGITKNSIDNILNLHPDTKLIITVDNGIVANDAISLAEEKEIDVIVTDHHAKGNKAPKAHAIVHTTKMCGAGVAWILAKNLKFLKDEDINEKLELACLATVADLVPLMDLNRIIVKYGIEYLKETKRPGLIAIFNLSSIDREKIGVYEIGHIICPRINATGRLNHAIDSLRLICSSDKNYALKMASRIENTNKQRQQMVIESVSHAKLSVVSQEKLGKIVGVSSETYSEGVVGLISSRLVEEYYRPSFAISVKDKISKGSARSIYGVNIVELLRSVGHLLKEVGGHPMAAGFSIETQKIEEFFIALEEKMNEFEENIFEKSINIDMEIPSNLVTKDLYKKIQVFAPFGMGNFEPVFLTKGFEIKDFRIIGKERNHLKLALEKDGLRFDSIGFGMGEMEISRSNILDAVYLLDENEWNGNIKLQLKLRDLRSSSLLAFP